MQLLLDSHTLIWSVDDPAQVSPVAMNEMSIASNELFLSIGSIWEMGIKYAKGNLSLSLPFPAWMNKAIADLGLVILPITLDHIERQTSLPFHHRDPFDRLLAAQPPS